MCWHPIVNAQQPEVIIDSVAHHWIDLHNGFRQPEDVWGNYTLDLTLEALLLYDYWTKNDLYTAFVMDVFNKREIAPTDTIDYKSQPFCSINFTLGTVTNNSDWYIGFIHETNKMIAHAKKSKEGGILIHHQNNYYLLIDYLQEYASRVAKTGYLTQDTLMFRESVDQFHIYEKILSDPSTGLWHQGRGWCNDTSKLSQGAWSRGHGWLLRGIVTTMLYLPERYQHELQSILERVSHALIHAQSHSGMYHILLNRPVDESAPDVSGTGMIAYYMFIAVKKGWLNERDFKPGIVSATNEMKKYVSEQGEILSSSKGPGPLCNEDEYIDYQPEIDEKHGFQGVIYGMIAELLLDE